VLGRRVDKPCGLSADVSAQAPPAGFTGSNVVYARQGAFIVLDATASNRRGVRSITLTISRAGEADRSYSVAASRGRTSRLNVPAPETNPLAARPISIALPASSRTTVTASARYGDGTTETTTVQYRVLAARLVLNPTVVQPKGISRLSWTTANAESLSLTGTLTPTTSGPMFMGGGPLTIAATVNSTFRLVASADPQSSPTPACAPATLTVVCSEAMLSLAAPGTPPPAAPGTLRMAFNFQFDNRPPAGVDHATFRVQGTRTGGGAGLTSFNVYVGPFQAESLKNANIPDRSGTAVYVADLPYGIWQFTASSPQAGGLTHSCTYDIRDSGTYPHVFFSVVAPDLPPECPTSVPVVP
jgi:hypothetical protein